MSGFQGPPPPFGYQQAPYSGPYAQQVPVTGTYINALVGYITVLNDYVIILKKHVPIKNASFVGGSLTEGR
jgi:hypothetical protein